jgi:hypothetical protein
MPGLAARMNTVKCRKLLLHIGFARDITARSGFAAKVFLPFVVTVGRTPVRDGEE